MLKTEITMKSNAITKKSKKSAEKRVRDNSFISEIKKHNQKYIMVLPVVLFYLLFCYKPMYGVIIAFQDYSPTTGFLGSEWVGLNHFKAFVEGLYFWRIIRNTFLISLYDLVFGFPLPIVLALLLNEIRSSWFKRTVQTISYLPHFISVVVVCGILKDFCMSTGFFNQIITSFTGGDGIALLSEAKYFRTIFTATNIWQSAGWSSIIYLAALAAINPELYEAATIDGAGRFKKVMNITIPGIMPTITTLFILRMGKVLHVGFEKIILLYNSSTKETAEVISSFVYQKGLQELSWSFSTAIGLFEAVINLFFLLCANYLSKKVNETSLW